VAALAVIAFSSGETLAFWATLAASAALSSATSVSTWGVQPETTDESVRQRVVEARWAMRGQAE